MGWLRKIDQWKLILGPELTARIPWGIKVPNMTKDSDWKDVTERQEWEPGLLDGATILGPHGFG